MGKILGLGGVFIRAKNKETSMKWYQDFLGIKMEDWGAVFSMSQNKNLEYQAFSIFKDSSEYFPTYQAAMINWIVDDMESFCKELEEKGIKILNREESEFGKFAWIHDLDNNKIELLEPPKK